MKTILVVANETIGGSKLLDTIREKAADGKARVVICVPRKTPKHGRVVYDDTVYDAARVRVDMARVYLRTVEDIEAIGEVGDTDPYSATTDAWAEFHPDEIIISTFAGPASGWQRRDLIERVRDAVYPTPVEHVVLDLESEGLPFNATLVVANRTASTDDLLARLKEKASDGQMHVFTVVVPQEGGDGVHASRARGRMVQLVDRLRAAGLNAAGMIGDPDPYTAIQNALEFFRMSDIVVATLPATRSGWLRADLVERVRKGTGLPVEHVEVRESEAARA